MIRALKLVCLVSVLDCHDCLLLCDWLLLLFVMLFPAATCLTSLLLLLSPPSLSLHLQLMLVSLQYHSVVQVVECHFADCWLVFELLSSYLFKTFIPPPWSLSCPALSLSRSLWWKFIEWPHNNNVSRNFCENVHQQIDHEKRDQIEGKTRWPLFATQQTWGYFQILGDYQSWLQDVLPQG